MGLQWWIRRLTGGRRLRVAAVARFLVIVWTLLLATMPLTEHFWTFDRFLRGGNQDFELTLCTLIAVLCLVLLLAQYARRGLAVVIALREWLRFVFGANDLRACRMRLEALGEASPGRALSACYSLPMRI